MSSPAFQNSFLSLLEIHARLSEGFLDHQGALLDLDIPLGLMRLQSFEQQLKAHIRVEEDLLLPIYRRAGSVPHGSVELFTGEHRRMIELVSSFTNTIGEILSRPLNLKWRVLDLFDHQALFKGLLEHHDLRERNILYPTIDGVTTEEERRDLLLRCAT